MGNRYLEQMRAGETLSPAQQLCMTVQLSIPAMLAQVSSIAMQYIDASMVGHLGANASGSIGLVSSTTWLFGGLCSAAAIGFTVQVAQSIGAGKDQQARSLVRQGLVATLGFSLLLLGIGVSLSSGLPAWLGGEPDICPDASRYFLVYSLTLPVTMSNYLTGGMIQCSGNMKLPSFLHVVMCLLDVVFNSLLIFPTRQAWGITLPGAGLGVMGAALGTSLAQLTVGLILLGYLLAGPQVLALRREEKLVFSPQQLKRAVKISLPVGCEQFIMCSAYVMATRIVSPLGTIAIAANSFAVTAESLCYMPGYGIGTAATTLIGQSVGAGRKDLTRRLAWLTTGLGVGIMTVSGALMYLFAPAMMALLTPDPSIRALGAAMLRIEAFAEPLYGASIVAAGAFRGAGDTFMPSCFNFLSMWCVRIPLSAFLAPRMGLQGVWLAMCIELCFRGLLYLGRMKGRGWMKEKL